MKTNFVRAALICTALALSTTVATAAIDPIPGVDIIVKKNPGGSVVIQTHTDANGSLRPTAALFPCRPLVGRLVWSCLTIKPAPIRESPRSDATNIMAASVTHHAARINHLTAAPTRTSRL